MSDDAHVFDEEAPETVGDSAVFRVFGNGDDTLKVYAVGELTVVGFDGQEVPDDVCLGGYREDLLSLIREHGCKVLGFDLSGVQHIPSGLLGLLESIKDRGVAVELYNPSDEFRDALKTTRLDSKFAIREIEL